MQENNGLENLVGAIGHPMGGNDATIIADAAFEDLGLTDWRYLVMDVLPENLEDAIRGLKAFQMRGLNLTMPHKIKVIEYLDELSPSARIIGAVNTIINKDGLLIGENTDGKGFLMSLESNGVDPKNKNIVILGAGGAARAIAVELALAGANSITIVNRPRSKAMGDELVATLKENTSIPRCRREDWDGTYKIPSDTDIVVNATPVGMFPDKQEMPDINLDSIASDMYVQDVIAPSSALIQEMERRGIRCGSGTGMFINQAAINTELWTGKLPNTEPMLKAYQELVRGKAEE